MNDYYIIHTPHFLNVIKESFYDPFHKALRILLKQYEIPLETSNNVFEKNFLLIPNFNQLYQRLVN